MLACSDLLRQQVIRKGVWGDGVGWGVELKQVASMTSVDVTEVGNKQFCLCDNCLHMYAVFNATF